MAVYFTSDTHYYHKNIIKYCNRPYFSVEEMNESLIANYNKRVGKDDTCYHLGDFGFAEPKLLRAIVDRLNGQKHLVLGNHDDRKNFLNVFSSVHQYMEIRVPDEEVRQGFQRIILFHYSMRVWNGSHRGTWQLYGHSHGTLPDDPTLLSMDVGVDPCGQTPISYEEVKAHMKKKTFKSIDHHGAD